MLFLKNVLDDFKNSMIIPKIIEVFSSLWWSGIISNYVFQF